MQIFVFPLGQTVFFPGTSKPLNIFEPRYLQMVEDSLRTGTPIGLGFVDDSTPPFMDASGQDFLVAPGERPQFVRTVMGVGKPMVVEKRPDGTQLVFIQNLGKVELGVRVKSASPYLVCEAEYLEENESVSADQIGPFTILNKLLGSWIAKNIPDPVGRDQFMSHINTPKEVLGCFSAFLVLDTDLQQAVLEENNYDSKIKLLSGLVAAGSILS